MFKVGRVLATIAVASMVMLTAVDLAEARRAGSGFGSRGTRTFSTPPITRTAPGDAAPINRTMTPQQTPGQTAGQQTIGQTRPGAQRPGLFGGFGRSLLGGLALGGLIGMLMGNGLGGAAGFLGLLLQVGLIFGAVMLAMRFFGRRNEPAAAGYSQRGAATGYSGQSGNGFGAGSFKIPQIGGGTRPESARTASQSTDEIGVGQADLDQFETMLKQVQAAYAAEDYAALRKLTTPEAMSWLAEELSENATKGLKNEVSDVHLVQGDVAEAWREDGADYATVAMRYESIDVTRERATGRVVEGDPDHPTEAVELWTFLRKRGGDWQVSAIQGMAA
ncbi:Tim44 domain-containing protein [Pararhizobium sp. LjRoot238]|uniref:Tim44 domain-containing protein n=1 Tax=Pararhizobium sp. LjRoot238 TaxID=3342293 RepID=UPI003ECD5245